MVPSDGRTMKLIGSTSNEVIVWNNILTKYNDISNLLIIYRSIITYYNHLHFGGVDAFYLIILQMFVINLYSHTLYF